MIHISTIRSALELLSGKWTMHILIFLLKNGKTGFADLQRRDYPIYTITVRKMGEQNKRLPL
jgi:DNA-binding HxlR family transcriptional regulator